MMFKYSFGLDEADRRIEHAVESVLDQGYRTPDIMAKGMKEVRTGEMGDRVARELEKS